MNLTLICNPIKMVYNSPRGFKCFLIRDVHPKFISSLRFAKDIIPHILKSQHKIFGGIFAITGFLSMKFLE